VDTYDEYDRHSNRYNDREELYETPDEHMEVDSDVNDDPGRELQLDASFEDWYRNIGYWVRQKEDMTQVPRANVFEAAVEMDEDNDNAE